MKQSLERFRTWWGGLAERERQVLSAGGAVLAVVLLYLVVWEPVANARAERQQALAASRSLAVRLELIGAEVQKNRGATPSITTRNQSLLSVVDQSSKAAQLGKAPSRLQPDGDTGVKLWIEDVSFDAVVRWLHDLERRHGVQVQDADIERRSGAGLVNVRLTLVRP